MRDWLKPVALHFERPLSPADRLALFFGHYDCRVYLTETGFIDVGAGSLTALNSIKSVPPSSSGYLGKIGRFCEVNPSAVIHYNGNHNHDAPVNVTFSVLMVANGLYPDRALKDPKPISIGSGVVISSGSEVLGGWSIGDGAVIGAGAIVTRDVDPFAIVAGTPAKPISKRQAPYPWWDLSTRYILQNLARLNDVVDSGAAFEQRPERPRFVFRVKNGVYELAGYLEAEEIKPISEAPVGVRTYVASALDGVGEPYWIPDCWSDDAPA